MCSSPMRSSAGHGGRVVGGRRSRTPKSGLRSREQLKAVTDGRFAMAEHFWRRARRGQPGVSFLVAAFRDALGGEGAGAFEAAAALRRLFADATEAALRLALAALGHLVGRPVYGAAALNALKIRTYDTTGTEVFGQVWRCERISFADLIPSGVRRNQCGALFRRRRGGAPFWRICAISPHITYAIPLSFGSVSLDAWERLSDADPRGDGGGAETTERQWGAMAGRVAHNFALMRENGVTIDEPPPLDVVFALSTAGAKSVIEWHGRVDADTAKVFEDYRARMAR